MTARVVVALVAIVSGSLYSQGRPDYSGWWAFDPSLSTKTQPGGALSLTSSADNPETVIAGGRVIDVPLIPILGDRFRAIQDETHLTIQRTVTPQSIPVKITGSPFGSPPTKKGPPVTYLTVYALDGTECRNTAPSPILKGAPIETVSTTKWDGVTLVMTIIQPKLGADQKQVRVFHLDAARNLVIDVTNWQQGVPDQTTTHAYKRAK